MRWILFCTMTAWVIPMDVRADPPDVDIRAEIAELKQLSTQLCERMAQLETQLYRRELLSRPLRPAFDSPEAVFETHQHAVALKRWSVVAQCYTPDAQEEHAATCLLLLMFGEMAVEGKDRQALFGYLRSRLCDKHLLKSGQVFDGVGEAFALGIRRALIEQALDPQLGNDLNVIRKEIQNVERQIADSWEPTQRELANAMRGIHDKSEFIADAMTLLNRYASKELFDSFAERLVDVTIDSNIARGFKISPAGQREPIVFRRIDEKWLIDRQPSVPNATVSSASVDESEEEFNQILDEWEAEWRQEQHSQDIEEIR